MQLPYFYEENLSGNIFTLSEETSKHCVQVLRMQVGEALQLTDGKGNLSTAIIINSNKKNCQVRIEKIVNHESKTKNISIAISLLKNPSRFEWFLEKATEIGVSVIHPLICDHTEKKNLRFDRMQQIVISAMLQSRQAWLPVLHQPTLFKNFIQQNFIGLKLIAHCYDEEKININQIKKRENNIMMLIGPEGDFSNEEIMLARAQNFIGVSLGETRLRTETAGIVAVTLLQHSV